MRALRAFPGVSVEPRLADVGGGVPDILVGYQARCYVFEIKDPEKPPSARRLTDDEATWSERWQGQYAVAFTAEDILAAIGA